MKRNNLYRTNVLICLVIALGFFLTSIFGYFSNIDILEQNTGHISDLTSDGIYYQIDSIFAKPVHISLTMANDSLLKTFLAEEESHADEEDFILTMRDYLLAYKTRYDYDSVFLVSAKTNRYYHYESGVDRILVKGDPENDWYYSFLDDSKEYALNIDNDEAQSANNGITIFINCKIYDADGTVMGVVGVGFDVDTLQKIFRRYEEAFHLRAYLVDADGTIAISTTHTGYKKTDLFQGRAYEDQKDSILSNKEAPHSLWYSSHKTKGYLVTRYIPSLKWHLIIECDTSALTDRLNRQFQLNIAILLLVVGSILLIVTRIVQNYKAQIISLTIEKEKLHSSIFKTVTEQLYENIHEIDITHNRAANEATEQYFESFGAEQGISYDEALKLIAREQIKEEFRKDYIDIFSAENVLDAYKEGRESLHYEFMITSDGGASYYWIRNTARIFFWQEDQSVRMMVYRQNINNEKSVEKQMLEKLQRDSLSGLYNKATTKDLICQVLKDSPENTYAFFILDIDDFKTVNDICGHAVGDLVIADFAKKLKRQFREDDIVGRIGGDEFVVFVPAISKESIQQKAQQLSHLLQYEFSDGTEHCLVSASIGIAMAPEAGSDFDTLYRKADSVLYQIKDAGKNGYIIYQSEEQKPYSGE